MENYTTVKMKEYQESNVELHSQQNIYNTILKNVKILNDTVYHIHIYTYIHKHAQM